MLSGYHIGQHRKNITMAAERFIDSAILETLGPSSFHYYTKIPSLPYVLKSVCIILVYRGKCIF